MIDHRPPTTDHPQLTTHNLQPFMVKWRFVALTTLRYWVVVGVVGMALLLRLHAALLLDTDFDEATYLRATRLYAQHFAANDWLGVINERNNYEHPILVKLIFGAIMLNENSYEPAIQRSGANLRGRAERGFNAVVGALTAGVVALENPLAGLLVALNPWHIKYTSEVYLEALPCLFAAIMFVLLRHSKRTGDWLFWLAAIMLGLTAAGKYIFAVGGVTAVIWLLWRDRRAWKLVLAWAGLSLLVFYIANPALWLDPFGRLWDSLTYSVNYTSSGTVTKYAYQWWQPIVWLLTEPDQPVGHFHTFPLPIVGLVTVISLISLPWLWQKDRFLSLWIWVNLFFLFIWPTKWSQYILIMTVPFALATASYLWHLAQVFWQRAYPLVSRRWSVVGRNPKPTTETQQT